MKLKKSLALLLALGMTVTALPQSIYALPQTAEGSGETSQNLAPPPEDLENNTQETSEETTSEPAVEESSAEVSSQPEQTQEPTQKISTEPAVQTRAFIGPLQTEPTSLTVTNNDTTGKSFVSGSADDQANSDYWLDDTGALVIAPRDNSSTNITIGMAGGVAESYEHIKIQQNDTATSAQDVTITLNAVNIQASSMTAAAFDMSGYGGNVTVVLQGENTLSSASGYAGLQKDSSGTLTIQSASAAIGSLSATGGAGAAGIGGGYDQDTSTGIATGDITIKSGNIQAQAGADGAAGIGCGSGAGLAGDITIKGGMINASGSSFNLGTATDIGCGQEGTADTGANVIIQGGSVTCTHTCINPAPVYVDNSDAKVYPLTLTLDGVSTATDCTALSLDNTPSDYPSAGYGMQTVQTSGSITVWMPKDTGVHSMTTTASGADSIYRPSAWLTPNPIDVTPTSTSREVRKGKLYLPTDPTTWNLELSLSTTGVGTLNAGTDYYFVNNTLVLSPSFATITPITVTMATNLATGDKYQTTTQHIWVQQNKDGSNPSANVQLILDGVKIEETDALPALDVTGFPNTVTLQLKGENTLTGGSGSAGVQKNSLTGTLVIESAENTTGSLTAKGVVGIGGGATPETSVQQEYFTTGNIEIKSGILTAQGTSGVAIGCEDTTLAGDIVITGGTVKTLSSNGGGAGNIGSNKTEGNTGSVVITGGNVGANSINPAPVYSKTATNANVYKLTLTLDDLSSVTNIDSLGLSNLPSDYPTTGYGITDMQTIADGNALQQLSVWLPNKTSVQSAVSAAVASATEGVTYVAVWPITVDYNPKSEGSLTFFSGTLYPHTDPSTWQFQLNLSANGTFEPDKDYWLYGDTILISPRAGSATDITVSMANDANGKPYETTTQNILIKQNGENAPDLTITLNNVTINTTSLITNTKSFAPLDINYTGKVTVNLTGENALTLNGSTANKSNSPLAVINLADNGNLVVDGTGSLSLINDKSVGIGRYGDLNNVNITIQGGNIAFPMTTDVATNCGIGATGTLSNSTITIKDDAKIDLSGVAALGIGARALDNSSVIIEGGEITCNMSEAVKGDLHGLIGAMEKMVNQSRILIKGGSVKDKTSAEGTSITTIFGGMVMSSDSKIAISGGTVEAVGAMLPAIGAGMSQEGDFAGTIEISGGIVSAAARGSTNNLNDQVMISPAIGAGPGATLSGNIKFTGGTVTATSLAGNTAGTYLTSGIGVAPAVEDENGEEIMPAGEMTGNVIVTGGNLNVSGLAGENAPEGFSKRPVYSDETTPLYRATLTMNDLTEPTPFNELQLALPSELLRTASQAVPAGYTYGMKDVQTCPNSAGKQTLSLFLPAGVTILGAAELDENGNPLYEYRSENGGYVVADDSAGGELTRDGETPDDPVNPEPVNPEPGSGGDTGNGGATGGGGTTGGDTTVRSSTQKTSSGSGGSPATGDAAGAGALAALTLSAAAMVLSKRKRNDR